MPVSVMANQEHVEGKEPASPPDVVIVSPDGKVAQPAQQRAQLPSEVVEQPAKVMRIGSMVKQLLEEVRRAPLDEAGRSRLREIHETSVRELSSGLSSELQDELAQFSLAFSDDAPTEAELRVAQAQLVGWLEGLFHGIQATLFAQQMVARAQLDELHRPGLPPGQPRQPGGPTGYL